MIPIRNAEHFEELVFDPSVTHVFLDGEPHIRKAAAGSEQLPYKARSFTTINDKVFLESPSRRELESHFRFIGKSRSQASALATEYFTKKEEKIMSSKSPLGAKRAQLEKLENRFQAIAFDKDKTDEYYDLISEINSLKDELGGPVNAPLTKPGPQAYGDAARVLTGGDRFSVKVGDRILPVLAREERMTAHFPRPQGEEGKFTLAEYVRAQMGIGQFRAAIGSGAATVPEYVGAQVIDDVRARTVVVRAGAGTIPITGPTNLARITGDATVYQHTEATADISETSPTVVAVELNPKALVAAIPLPFEVVNDSPNLDTILNTSISAAFALKLDLLSIATLLADTNIPKDTVAHDPNAWANVVASVGAALAANQDLPTAWIGNTADFIARVAELGTANGNWLGKPSALADMVEYPTTSISAGFAFLGGFPQGFAVALRQDLRLEVVRFQKTTSAQHVLYCTMRADGVVLQPKRLFKCLKTIV